MYPTVFNGLGTMGEDYVIKLKPNFTPNAIFSPRQIPHSYRKKINEKLHRMETMGVISRIEEPTDWCSAIVAVPKKNGLMRVCVDLCPLNEHSSRSISTAKG